MKHIFLDTNVLVTDLTLGSAKFSALIEYARRLRHRVAMSALVVDETCAIYERHLREHWKTLEQARTGLRRLGYALVGSRDPEPDWESSVAAFRKRLIERLELSESDILPYSSEAMIAALRRAMNRRAPCSDRGEEIRDAVLWEQATRLCAPHVEICFISMNRKEFGPTGILRAELMTELATLPGSFFWFSSLDDFLRDVAEPVEFITRDWLKSAVSVSDIEKRARGKIECLGTEHAETRLHRRESPTGYGSLVKLDLEIDDFYVNEIARNEFVVNVIYAGTSEVEVETSVLGDERRGEPDGDDEEDVDSWRGWHRYRVLEFELAISLELIVKERKVESWSLDEVTDCV